MLSFLYFRDLVTLYLEHKIEELVTPSLHDMNQQSCESAYIFRFNISSKYKYRTLEDVHICIVGIG